MSTRTIYCAIGAWLAAIAAVTVFGAFSGVPMTIGVGVFVMAVGFMSPAIMFTLWSDAGRQTAAQLIHTVDRKA